MILEQAYHLKVINQSDIRLFINDSKIKNLSSLFEDFYAVGINSKELVFIKLPCSNIIKLINLIKLIEYHQAEIIRNKEKDIFLRFKGILNKDNEYYIAFKRPFMSVINITKNSNVNKTTRSKIIEDLINALEFLGKKFNFNVYLERYLFFITNKFKLKFLYLGISKVNSSCFSNVIEKYFSEERNLGVLISPPTSIKKDIEINYKLSLIIIADLINHLSLIEELTENSKLIRDSQINNPSLFYSIHSLDKVKRLFNEILRKSLTSVTSPVKGNNININDELKLLGKDGLDNVRIYDPKDLYFDIQSSSKRKKINMFKGDNSDRFDFMINNFFQEQYENQIPIFMNEINRNDVVPEEIIRKMVREIDSNNLRLSSLNINSNKLVEMKKIWGNDSFNKNLSNLFIN
jgi:hypothetical protein